MYVGFNFDFVFILLGHNLHSLCKNDMNNMFAICQHKTVQCFKSMFKRQDT